MRFITDSEISYKADIDVSKQGLVSAHVCIADPNVNGADIYREIGKFLNTESAFRAIAEYCLKISKNKQQQLLMLYNNGNELIDANLQDNVLRCLGLVIDVKNDD